MTKKDIINKIIAGYALKLNAQKERLDAMLEKAREFPDFNRIDGRLRECELAAARAAAYGENADALEAEIASLTAERQAFLSAHGLTTEITYDCPACRDSGWTGDKLCPCVRQRLHDELLADSGITFPLHSFSSADFSVFPEGYRETARTIYKVMKSYCDKYPAAKFRDILITGDVGVGKTHLVSCIADAVLHKGETVQFLTAFSFNNLMLKYHLAPVEEKEGLMAPLLETSLLILDDLGTEAILKNVTLEYLYQVLNERSVRCLGTVITTNLSPTALLGRYGSRVFSRMADKSATYIVNMQGSDLRLKIKEKQ